MIVEEFQVQIITENNRNNYILQEQFGTIAMHDKQKVVKKLQTGQEDIMYEQHDGKIGDEDASFVKLLYCGSDDKITSCEQLKTYTYE